MCRNTIVAGWLITTESVSGFTFKRAGFSIFELGRAISYSAVHRIEYTFTWTWNNVA
jgi:hypothetical protein